MHIICTNIIILKKTLQNREFEKRIMEDRNAWKQNLEYLLNQYVQKTNGGKCDEKS